MNKEEFIKELIERGEEVSFYSLASNLTTCRMNSQIFGDKQKFRQLEQELMIKTEEKFPGALTFDCLYFISEEFDGKQIIPGNIKELYVKCLVYTHSI
ncbi:MAG: hypothetical protein PF569_05780 [Candidatus Woesearchaeota archaeon]|nr:hypothetical protein [Candidatus Woesearchaeota archaeon]